MSDGISIAELWIYPVKSCRGISVAAAEVGATGFVHDRTWLVVDGDGRFLSQRGHPELATVEVELDRTSLRLAAPGADPLVLPLASAETGAPIEVEVWGDRVSAVDAGPGPAAWFGRVLGRSCRLARMPATVLRPVDPRYAGPEDRVAFADGFPFLLLSRASVAELSRRAGRTIELERFRPNLVVEGCRPHAEDGWRHLEVGGVTFRVAKPCARCVVTTVDQATGVRGGEPLTTLATYRRRDDKILFGQNLVHAGRGVVRVGDPVRVA